MLARTDASGRLPIREAEHAAERAAFRAFVRTHHPDVGGDPERFARELPARRARVERALSPDSPEQTDTPGAPAAERCDAPIVFVDDRGGFLAQLRALLRRVRLTREAPRVQ